MICPECCQGSLGSYCPFCGAPSDGAIRDAIASEKKRALGQDDSSWWSGVKDALNPTPAIVEGLKAADAIDVANLPKAAAAVQTAFTPAPSLPSLPFDVGAALKWMLYGGLAIGAGVLGVKGYDAIARK